MTNLKEKTLQFLKNNGFKEFLYEDQGLTFYKLEITDEDSLRKLLNHYFDINEDEDIDGVSFVMEIQTNGEDPQWTFTDGYELFDILNNEDEFIEYVDFVKKLIKRG